MSYANEMRRKAAYWLIGGSLLPIAAGIYLDGLWGTMLAVMGGLLMCVGIVLLTSLTIIDGVPWLLKLVSRHVEPVWDGEVIQMEGGGHKVRYAYDSRGSPWFVASDVCIAIGTRAPIRDAKTWGGIPLLNHGGHACFSETTVQSYLVPLAVKNLEANRLLLVLRNNIFRKLDKQREAANKPG